MILDADMTVAPEDLPRFFVRDRRRDRRAHQRRALGLPHGGPGYAVPEPPRQPAPRCDAHLVARATHERHRAGRPSPGDWYDVIAANRSYFGDFDLLGTSTCSALRPPVRCGQVHMKIVDIPARYGERRHGAPTSIDGVAALSS